MNHHKTTEDVDEENDWNQIDSINNIPYVVSSPDIAGQLDQLRVVESKSFQEYHQCERTQELEKQVEQWKFRCMNLEDKHQAILEQNSLLRGEIEMLNSTNVQLRTHQTYTSNHQSIPLDQTISRLNIMIQKLEYTIAQQSQHIKERNIVIGRVLEFINQFNEDCKQELYTKQCTLLL